MYLIKWCKTCIVPSKLLHCSAVLDTGVPQLRSRHHRESIIYKHDILHSPIRKLMQLLQITPAIHIECMFPINAAQHAQDPPNFSICVIVPKVTPTN